MGERNYTVEIDQETDGSWIAEILTLPGLMAYGATEQEPIANAEALAFRVIAVKEEKRRVTQTDDPRATGKAHLGVPRF